MTASFDIAVSIHLATHSNLLSPQSTCLLVLHHTVGKIGRTPTWSSSWGSDWKAKLAPAPLGRSRRTSQTLEAIFGQLCRPKVTLAAARLLAGKDLRNEPSDLGHKQTAIDKTRKSGQPRQRRQEGELTTKQSHLASAGRGSISENSAAVQDSKVIIFRHCLGATSQNDG
jgi:hypothetical protein